MKNYQFHFSVAGPLWASGDPKRAQKLFWGPNNIIPRVTYQTLSFGIEMDNLTKKINLGAIEGVIVGPNGSQGTQTGPNQLKGGSAAMYAL